LKSEHHFATLGRLIVAVNPICRNMPSMPKTNYSTDLLFVPLFPVESPCWTYSGHLVWSSMCYQLTQRYQPTLLHSPTTDQVSSPHSNLKYTSCKFIFWLPKCPVHVINIHTNVTSPSNA
jgi:hypothetical protein